MRDSALDVESMGEFLLKSVRGMPVMRLVTELEEINKYKLRDSDLMNCTELQCYYLDRQSAIISYLRDMLDKDGLNENL